MAKIDLARKCWSSNSTMVSTYLSGGGAAAMKSAMKFFSYVGNEKHLSANPQHIVLHVFTKQCPLPHLCQYRYVL